MWRIEKTDTSAERRNQALHGSTILLVSVLDSAGLRGLRAGAGTLVGLRAAGYLQREQDQQDRGLQRVAYGVSRWTCRVEVVVACVRVYTRCFRSFFIYGRPWIPSLLISFFVFCLFLPAQTLLACHQSHAVSIDSLSRPFMPVSPSNCSQSEVAPLSCCPYYVRAHFLQGRPSTILRVRSAI